MFPLEQQLKDHPLLLNEDIQLNFILRDDLERAGLLFAPTDTALYFSAEFMGKTLHNDVDLTKVFGHHCQNRRLRGHNYIEYQMTREQMKELHGEELVMDLLETYYGYEVNYVHSNA